MTTPADPVSAGLTLLSPADLARRWAVGLRLIRENGVTYNVYGDPHGTDRPWPLDPLPVVVPEAEFLPLEAGLTQRARLLDSLLADLYGPQRTIAAGVFPPALLFAHPGFLRPVHGVPVRGGRYLHLYGVDLGRGPDGTYRVLGDRTQAPSGAGYALENRLVVSRVLPELFDRGRVRRLAPFFRTLRDSVRDLAPRHRDNPRVVLLTPGPFNETYFEHAYLARYLGWTLAEGGDLTVRDAKVFLKLLGGLQPVDVIFRRLDDDYCDPLELRGDSFLGVPGLVEAVRAGNVAVANALGSGLLESPAVLGFLPVLCRFLLGEELRLPSVETWWCGEPDALAHVLANLPRMVVKPATPATPFPPTFGDRLSKTELVALADRIRAEPTAFVGQGILPLATVPAFADGKVEPRHAVQRWYLAAGPDGYELMPGGLVRVTPTADSRVVSMQAGGGSKDAWVLSSEPVTAFTLLPPAGRPVKLTRGGGDLPSRTADNLFWLGRYTERADGIARVLRTADARLLERADSTPLARALDPASTDATETLARFHADELPDAVRAIRRVASLVRDRISLDMWRGLSSLPEDDPPQLIAGLAAFAGLIADGMTRGPGWRFLEIGRRLERALNLIGLLRAVGKMTDPVTLEAALDVADSGITYRSRYLNAIQPAAVFDLLLADEGNPRAVAYQLAALAGHIDHLPRDEQYAGPNAEQRLMLGVLTSVRLADVSDPDKLDHVLVRTGRDLTAVSDAITRSYLTHLQPARHLLALDRGHRP